MPTQSSNRGDGGSRIPVFALLLVGLGVLLLLQTLGIAPWAIWGVLWRFWPLVIVFIGLNLLLGRTMPAVVGLAIIAGLVLAVGVSWVIANREGEKATVQFSEPLGELTSASVEVVFGAGELRVEALPDQSANLAEGTLTGPENSARWSFQRTGTQGLLRLERAGGSFITASGTDWELRLTRKIPLTLRVRSGASDIALDLQDLRATQAEIDVGASDVDIVVPDQGQSALSVEGGAASVNIRVPEGVAARIVSQQGLSSLEVDQERFPRSEDAYQSQDFDTATNKVTITLRTGLASVSVR